MRALALLPAALLCAPLGAAVSSPEALEARVDQAEARLEALEREAEQRAEEVQRTEEALDDTARRRGETAERVEQLDARLRLLRIQAAQRTARLETLRARQAQLVAPLALGVAPPGDPLAVALGALAERHTPHIALVRSDLQTLEREIDQLRARREARHGALAGTDTSLAIHRTALERRAGDHAATRAEAAEQREVIASLLDQLESLAPSALIPGASLIDLALQSTTLPPPGPMPSQPASPEPAPPHAPPLREDPEAPQIPMELF